MNPASDLRDGPVPSTGAAPEVVALSAAPTEHAAGWRAYGRDAWLRLVGYGVVWAPMAAVLVVSFVVTPEQISSGAVTLSPECWFRSAFGVGCPTCGLTRAFTALSHLRWSDALDYHRAAPIVYLLWWVGTVALGRLVVQAVGQILHARRAVRA